MASEERQSMILSSKLSSSSSLVDQENMSTSPNGPLSDLNYGSSHSSTSGSDMGSPETENEDEAVLAELTRRMAEFTFEDDDDEEDVQSQKSAADSFLQENNYEGGGVGYNSSSSGYDYNQAINSASKQPTAESGLLRNPNADIFLGQIYPMRNQQHTRKEAAECGGRSGNKTAEQKDHHRGSKMQDKKALRSSVQTSSFPNLPLPSGGSGMRAVFLNGSKSNSVSNGTGVFIPNSNFSKADSKKKTGCSTVLIPARVLQTLQQHFNNVGAKSQSQNAAEVSTNQPWKNDVLARINGLLSQQQDQAVFKIQPPETTTHEQEELRLPHEWTY